MKRKWFSDIKSRLLNEDSIDDAIAADDIANNDAPTNNVDEKSDRYKKWDKLYREFSLLYDTYTQYDLLVYFPMYKRKTIYFRENNTYNWYMRWKIISGEHNKNIYFVDGLLIEYENFIDYEVDGYDLIIHLNYQHNGKVTKEHIKISIIEMHKMNPLNYIPVDYDNLDSLLNIEQNMPEHKKVINYFSHIRDVEKLKVASTRSFHVRDVFACLRGDGIDLGGQFMSFNKLYYYEDSLRMDDRFLLLHDGTYIFWFFKYNEVDPRKFI